MTQQRAEYSFRITELSAKNFRSIRETTLRLSNLTVLVGRNASGKSNLMDVARFVSEALQGNLESAITRRGGMMELRRWSAKRPYNIEIGIAAEVGHGRLEYGFVLASRPGGEYLVRREHGRFWTGPGARPITYVVNNGIMSAPGFLISKGETSEPIFAGEEAEDGPRELALPLFRRLGRLTEVNNRRLEFSTLLSTFSRSLSRMRFYHIFPNEIREIQRPARPVPLSEHGENLASTLKALRASRRQRFDQVVRAMGNLVPGVDGIDIRQSGGYLVTRLRHAEATAQGESAWFVTAQEAEGTLRLLGLLVALYQYPAPSFLAIEEPELNVHPGASAKLADYVKEGSRRSQILLTTHSPELIDRLPPQSIRAVTATRGLTSVGPVSKKQLEAVRQQLFSLGEIHQTEGLEPELQA